jgi:transcriptional regulator with XRE-family HTH domain
MLKKRLGNQKRRIKMFMDKQKFAEILTLQMVEKGINQAELARKIRSSSRSVGEWLKGEKDLMHSSLGRICKGLGVDPKIFRPAFILTRTCGSQSDPTGNLGAAMGTEDESDVVVNPVVVLRETAKES